MGNCCESKKSVIRPVNKPQPVPQAPRTTEPQAKATQDSVSHKPAITTQEHHGTNTVESEPVTNVQNGQQAPLAQSTKPPLPSAPESGSDFQSQSQSFAGSGSQTSLEDRKFSSHMSRKTTLGKNSILNDSQVIEEDRPVPRLDTLEEEDPPEPGAQLAANEETKEQNKELNSVDQEEQLPQPDPTEAREETVEEPFSKDAIQVKSEHLELPVLDGATTPVEKAKTTHPGNQQLHSFQSIPINSMNFITVHNGRLQDYYTVLNHIGQGATGLVSLCENKETGMQRAVKSMYKISVRQQEASQMYFEFDLIKQLDHPNVIKLYEVIEDPRKYHVVTEYYTGGELFERILNVGQFSESLGAQYAHQIISAMRYCHSQNIVHRDLKPENILFQTKEPDSQLVIIDFGTSRTIKKEEKMSKTYGTVFYIAPEVLAGQYTAKCDVWSLGVVIYILLCGYVPFGGVTDSEIFESIRLSPLEFFSPGWDAISGSAKDLISNMLNRDVEQRFSMDQCFEHPWIQESLQTERQTEQTESSSMSLDNLRNYRASRKLEKAVITFISSQLTTISETAELKQIFNSFDVNGDGILSYDEIKNGYHEMGYDIEDMESMIKEIDVDLSGCVNYTEFIAASINKQKLLSKDRLEAAFKAFDLDGSGKIGIDELKQLLEREGKLAEDSEWIKVITEADTNQDGQIDLKEFKDLMIKLI